MNSHYSFEIKIVYDNICHEKGFLMGFGFSALIYNQFSHKYLLFDTGAKSDLLFHNLKMCDVDISDIGKVIISHGHLDHAGGLREFYMRNPDLEIYVPIGVENAFKKAYLNADIYGISKLREIDKNIYSSGQFEWTIHKEHALFLKTRENEIVIVVGCSHPGVEKFILRAREISRIKAIIGGFHEFRKFSYLENIKLIAACHCTRHRDEIKNRFPNQFKQVCVGTSLTF